MKLVNKTEVEKNVVELEISVPADEKLRGAGFQVGVFENGEGALLSDELFVVLLKDGVGDFQNLRGLFCGAAELFGGCKEEVFNDAFDVFFDVGTKFFEQLGAFGGFFISIHYLYRQRGKEMWYHKLHYFPGRIQSP